MIFTRQVRTPRFTKAEIKAAGIDPRAHICPHHPNIQSINGLRDIILVPYRTTKFDKAQGKDVIIAMGTSCPRCYAQFPSDMHPATGGLAALPGEQPSAPETPKSVIEPLPHRT